MPMHPAAKRLWNPFFTLAILCAMPVLSHAVDPKFALDPSVLSKKFAMPPSPSAAKRETGAAAPREKMSSYTVKPGDQLYKVLSREYGVSGARAEALVQRIKRLNHLSDIRNLKGGSTLMIPAVEAAPAPKSARTRVHSVSRAKKTAKAALRVPAPDYGIKLAKVARGADAEVVEAAREVWPQLVASAGTRTSDHFDYLTDTFSLSLDPEKYPTLPAQDGGSILVDGGGTLPALVKTLIQEKNPQVRIVSENPGNRQRFYRSLLTAAQFYSFEEDFSVDFGTDPKITVHADFKIEKSPDSLLRQDVALLNVSENRRATPDGLVRLLAGNGFRVVEAGNPSYQGGSGAGDLLYQVTGKEPKKILDSFLDALSVPFETGKSIDLYAQEHIGVRLDVPVDRYFEDHGQRYVVALFNGDPVNYTLIRLLETKGYRVIMLQEGDDFHSIADKVLSRLHIPGRYGEHDLWPVRNVGYGVRMSGAMIRDNRNGDRNLFVTDRDLDPLVKELADLNGYRLLDGR